MGSSFAFKSDCVLKPLGRPEISMKGEWMHNSPLYALASHG